MARPKLRVLRNTTRRSNERSATLLDLVGAAHDIADDDHQAVVLVEHILRTHRVSLGDASLRPSTPGD